MAIETFKTFWDIEKEKTWRIYILFGFLITLYFLSFYLIWLLVKLCIYLKQSLGHVKAPFYLFGWDTLVVLIIAGIIAYIHWYYSNAEVVGQILKLLNARYPDKHDKYHHIFENVVDEIETSAGGIKVERYVLPTGAMNAFALADLKERKVIGVTEGLLSRLNREELQSVTAHEMAHIVSNDCLQTTIACSLFNVYSEALARINRSLTRALPLSFMTEARQRDAVAISVFSIPVLIILFITDIFSQLLNMFISREKEYRADALAVKLTRNPLSLASALYKIGTRWRGAGYGGEHLSPVFIMSPEYNVLDETESFYANLFSTHPPLVKRLQIILDLAHADFREINEQLQKSAKIKTETEVVKPQPKFFVQLNNKWAGSFTILQLQALDGLTPETKLRLEGSDEIVIANDVPALTHFFLIRDEPIWKIRRLCPVCRQWLIVQEYEGLFLWRCAFCNGILIEKDKLPRIIVRKEKGFTEQVQRLATLLKKEVKQKHPHFKLLIETPHPKFCPRCGKPMVRKFYSYAYFVEIDECQVCDLTWFDQNELEILQCLTEMAENEK